MILSTEEKYIAAYNVNWRCSLIHIVPLNSSIVFVQAKVQSSVQTDFQFCFQLNSIICSFFGEKIGE